MKEKIFTTKAPKPVGPYSQAILADKVLYASGQIALDAESGLMVGEDIQTQTKKVCENIEEVLAAANFDFENVVKTTCYLSDMDNFSDFNEIYSEYFISSPARSCIAAKTLPKNALVEIDFIAI